VPFNCYDGLSFEVDSCVSSELGTPRDEVKTMSASWQLLKVVS
jgi:hypothetical protein